MEYIRRKRKLRNSKLNGPKLLISLPSYSVAFVDWTNSELANLDRRARKKFNMNGRLHSRPGVTKLCIPLKEGGSGLILIKDCV